jgi:hypothetical protein
MYSNGIHGAEYPFNRKIIIEQNPEKKQAIYRDELDCSKVCSTPLGPRSTQIRDSEMPLEMLEGNGGSFFLNSWAKFTRDG